MSPYAGTRRTQAHPSSPPIPSDRPWVMGGQGKRYSPAEAASESVSRLTPLRHRGAVRGACQETREAHSEEPVR